MIDRPNPFSAAALERSVPRYTSYPTAPHFRTEMSSDDYTRWLTELSPDAPISLYLHVPFCDDLCWFCACRTQGAKRYGPVERYLQTLIMEIERVAEIIGPNHPVTQVHWGGGSPTVLSPEHIAMLAGAVNRAFPKAQAGEFAVEIDPRDMTEAKVDALAAAGLTRASIGVQDFEPAVQQAIGRLQGEELTRDVIQALRAHGISSINADLLYGLPLQTSQSLARTIERVVELAPDRLALFGYAHVPWMAKRQKMIPDESLPGSRERREQALLARRLLREAGYEAVGIDHFAKPGDSLAIAAREGRMRRNFQGYTVDGAKALLGFGASAIGALPQGYVQNDPGTATYRLRVEGGELPVKRGVALSLGDRMRRAAIEQILCSFSLDMDALGRRFGDFTVPLGHIVVALFESAPTGALKPWRGGFRITEAWRSHARVIAAEFDTYLETQPARHSLAV